MRSNSLTNARALRDGERAARYYESRDCAAHAVHSLRPSGLTGGAMVRRAYRQRSLVEVLLPDADKLWDPTLRRIDTLLDDEALVDRVTEALAQRHPESQRRGRLGTPAAVVLRMLVLKHLHDWSFDDCEREVRGACGSIRRSSKPTFTTRRTPRCWGTACACSRARCDGWASKSGSVPAPSAAGSSRLRSAVAPPVPG